MKYRTLYGYDLTKLKYAPDYTVIPMVEGRTLHIDADFLAYMVAYDATKTVEEMQNNCDAMIERLKGQSGAEHVQLHLTASGSTKGNRYDIAMLKEYQGTRKDKPKPKYLNIMREWMHEHRDAILNHECEADDSMSEAQYAAIAAGTPELSIIATKDKDLCMVPGLQVNWDTGEITDTGEDHFGWIELEHKPGKLNKDTGKKAADTYKLRGRGWKYFWAQLLMGDGADNVQGLPWAVHDKYTEGKYKRVGPVLAYNILKNVKTNGEAFKLVRKLFKDAEEEKPYRNYRVKPPKKESDPDKGLISYKDAMLSEMKLLWMRMDAHNDSCVVKWLENNR